MFNYGSFRIDKRICQWITSLEDLRKDKELETEFLSKANPFDSSFEYMIIHYQKPDSQDENPNVASEENEIVRIQDILHIYPLDMEAKSNFERTLDRRFRIEDPLWSDAWNVLQREKLIAMQYKGVENVAKAFGFKSEELEQVKQIVGRDVVEKYVELSINNEDANGKIPFWVYLLKYERHGHFGKGSIGICLDTVNIFINNAKENTVEAEAVENTVVGSILREIQSNNPEIHFENLKEILKNGGGKNFIDKFNSLISENGIDLFTASYLFLQFREEYSENGFNFGEDWITYGKKNFNKNFEVASFLLGLYLGHEHTCDFVYNTEPLKIFKSRAQLDAEEKEAKIRQQQAKEQYYKENGANRKSINNAPQRGKKSDVQHTSQTLFDSETNKEPLPPYPFNMRKKGQGGKPKKIKNDKEYAEYKEKGYEIVKENTK